MTDSVKKIVPLSARNIPGIYFGVFFFYTIGRIDHPSPPRHDLDISVRLFLALCVRYSSFCRVGTGRFRMVGTISLSWVRTTTVHRSAVEFLTIYRSSGPPINRSSTDR